MVDASGAVLLIGVDRDASCAVLLIGVKDAYTYATCRGVYRVESSEFKASVACARLLYPPPPHILCKAQVLRCIISPGKRSGLMAGHWNWWQKTKRRDEHVLIYFVMY